MASLFIPADYNKINGSGAQGRHTRGLRIPHLHTDFDYTRRLRATSGPRTESDKELRYSRKCAGRGACNARQPDFHGIAELRLSPTKVSYLFRR
jgi:hypothetical protein